MNEITKQLNVTSILIEEEVVFWGEVGVAEVEVNSEYWPGDIFEVVFSITSHFVPDGATVDPVPSLEMKTRNTVCCCRSCEFGVGAKVVVAELVKNGAVFTPRSDNIAIISGIH